MGSLNTKSVTAPHFITFEGPEGAGKSTQCRLLAEWLRTQGKNVLVTRQPGADEVGQKLRAILLDADAAPVTPRAELLLMMADRNQCVRNVITPHLEAGGIVICDRYADSSVAYQGYGRGLDLDVIDDLNDFATEGLEPDLTFLLDIDPAIGLARQPNRSRMEDEALSFHSRVRDGFLDIAEDNPKRVVVIDCSAGIDAVFERIRNEYETHNRHRAGA